MEEKGKGQGGRMIDLTDVLAFDAPVQFSPHAKKERERDGIMSSECARRKRAAKGRGLLFLRK